LCLYLHWQAGGGLLLRAPASVLEDIQQVRVSAEAAADVYGVLLRGGEVDVTATDELRRRRASGTGRCSIRLAPIGTPDLSRARRLDDHLAVRESPDGGTVGCVHCGTEIGPLAGSAYVAALARRESAPTEAGPHSWHDPLEYVDAKILFRQLCCPGCLTAVHSRVVPVGHPLPADDYRGRM
jgi:N-methylhydantoinase B